MLAACEAETEGSFLDAEAVRASEPSFEEAVLCWDFVRQSILSIYASLALGEVFWVEVGGKMDVSAAVDFERAVNLVGVEFRSRSVDDGLGFG